ncbi:hypothetical protein ACH5RR_030220 [Cinchona calisaya]|uniref:Uncharacterized protein n=1 Tax=Cinchona calisaya TaxID=153742 RepID=A0ABD2YX18_9GENT
MYFILVLRSVWLCTCNFYYFDCPYSNDVALLLIYDVAILEEYMLWRQLDAVLMGLFQRVVLRTKRSENLCLCCRGGGIKLDELSSEIEHSTSSFSPFYKEVWWGFPLTDCYGS